MAETMVRVPNKPKTRHRTVRLSDELWHEVQAVAKASDETASDAVRAGLEWYIKRNRHNLNRPGKV